MVHTMTPTDHTTLSEARGWLRERVDDGAHCPCCTQFAKVYRRKLNSAMAYALILMYRHGGDEDGWCYVPDLLIRRTNRGGDEAKARYWGLIEEPPDAMREDGSTRVGTWRLTADGAAFVRGELKVAKYARVYDGRCLGLDDAQLVDITDALGKRFNYRELMAGI
jgi:hypothetical protein